MAKLPVLKPREVVALLEKLDFTEVRQRGAHKQFRHVDGLRLERDLLARSAYRSDQLVDAGPAYECQRDFRGEPVTLAMAHLAVPKCRNCSELVFDYLAEEQINRTYCARTQAADGRNGSQAASPAGAKQEQG